jgi:hypothetical protein
MFRNIIAALLRAGENVMRITGTPEVGQVLTVKSLTELEFQDPAGGSGDATSLQGVPVTDETPDNGKALVMYQGAWKGMPVRGDALTLQGRTVDSATPAEGASLIWDSAASKWKPSATAGQGGGEPSP